MRVAIIGAGLAGITAARELEHHQVCVEIFEKSRGLGGRLASKRVNWANSDMSVDIGAQYFTARDTAFIQQVESWLKQGHIAEWSFTPTVIDPNSDTLMPSPDTQSRYVALPMMNKLAHYIEVNAPVHLNTRIAKLEQNDQQWDLVSDNDDRFSGYDWVISTLPAEQNYTLLTESGCDDVANTITPNTHTPCWALALATQSSQAIAPEIQGIFGDNTIAWVSRNSAKPQREVPADCDDVWVLHFSPQWSAEHLETEPSRITEAGLTWLQHYLKTSLTVKHSQLHFWRYAQLNEHSPIQAPMQAPVIDRQRQLALTGASYCGGRVEGAYLAGLKTALQVLSV